MAMTKSDYEKNVQPITLDFLNHYAEKCVNKFVISSDTQRVYTALEDEKVLRLVLIKRWNYDLKRYSKFKHQTMRITQSDYRGEDSCTEILIKVQLRSQIIFKQKLTLTLGVIL